MDTDRLLEMGSRGIHLLFETATITAAFRQDADVLRDAVSGRFDEIHFAVRHVSSLRSPLEARGFIERLEPPLRHILVLLYFELLDGRLRRNPVLH